MISRLHGGRCTVGVVRTGGLALLVAAALAAAVPGDASAASWLSGDLHIHTTYSHDSYGGPGDDNTGPDEGYTLGHSTFGQFSVAASRGLDYLAITDHDDIRSQGDKPGFGAMGVIPVPGYENSLEGHAQMLGARRLYPKGDSSTPAVRAAAAALRRDGGVFQVNHPAEGTTNHPDDLDWGYGYSVVPDTVEVWNISRLYQPPFPSASSNDDAVRYWQGWLDRGYRVGATGGSDNHYVSTTPVQGAGQPTTWVLSRSRMAAGVLEGLRAGRTFISHQPPGLGGPRVYLEADANRNGGFESVVGATVPPGSPLRVRVQGAPGSFLRVITNGGRQAIRPVAVTSTSFEHRFRLPAGRTWVRAEIFDPDLAEERGVVCDDPFGSQTTYCRNMLLVLAMTSAIYLRTPASPVTPAAPAALPRRISRGSARLRIARRSCRRRSLRGFVTGRRIRRVTYYLNGRRRRTVSRRDRRGRFTIRLRLRRPRAGRHRLTARVTFTATSATRARKLRARFRVCARRAARRTAPRFAG